MSAASRAAATASRGQIPTSAARSAGRSFTPSPRKPTVVSPCGAQGGDDARLVGGGAAGEDGGAAGEAGQLLVRERVEGVRGVQVAGGDAQIAQGARRGAGVVAGDDLDRDAALAQVAQGLRGGRHEGVGEGDEAGEGEAALVGGASPAA